MTAILAVAGIKSAAASSASVQLTDQTVSRGSKTSATATYQIANNGTVQNQASTILEAWLINGSAANYEVRSTVTLGTLNSGTTGSWLNCGTSRSWSITNSSSNTSASVTMTIEIRDVATQTVRASATITLAAFVNEGIGGGGTQ